jgi:DNA mismatch repair protein MutL
MTTATNQVKRLPMEVAERIAAGEVVDRPSSIVKELMENSLDAQATFVEVEIEEGGRQLIRVTDDGLGMTADDATLCVERHATSKLRAWEDLDSLYSFGFRGEALPSIAAVSRFELVTTARGENAGTRIVLEGPGSVRSEPAAGPPGTRVDVRDLFWNTPARRKFLKSPTGEGMKITELVTRFSILHPTIGFRLILNGKEKLFIPVQWSLARRLASFWKLDEKNLMSLQQQVGDILVEGVIAKPSFHRRNRTAQLIAVNKRLIKSQSLSQAFAEGYDPLVPRGRHPFCYVNLQLDPAAVDVNIHPTKAEVRFADARAPFRAIYRSIRNCLDEEKVETLKDSGWESALDDSAPAAKPTEDAFAQSIPPVLVQGKDFKGGSDFKRPARVPATDRVMEMYRPPEPQLSIPEEQEPVQGELLPSRTEQPVIEYLTRLYRSYLVVKVDSQLWIVDQHAAHERISYERLHRFQITGPDSQGLVVPFPLNLNAQEKQYLRDHRDRFTEVGFEFSEDDEDWSLCAVPPGLPGAKVEAFFEELLAELSSELPSEKGTPVAQYREKLRAMMACKSSIRARENITHQEAVRLISDLIQAEHSPYCPHGRPTRIRLDETTLERLFHRS